MKRLLLSAAFAALISTAAFGQDTSVLNYGPHNPVTVHEVPNEHPGPSSIDRDYNADMAALRAKGASDAYASGIELRRLHERVIDAQRNLDRVERGMYNPMGR